MRAPFSGWAPQQTHTGFLWSGAVFCVRKGESRLTLYGDDELGDDGQDLGASVLQHVMDPLAGEELVGMLRLT